ncbi:hypothetical protein [Mycobacterium sp.]|uniref:hypothetical protein n=1 Tax=Mycobacterium sp. TaxID=1785 RepID=UPI002D15B089|nr:hypothetical protein [Mycobacterium sp.]HME48715.1 hypothetical protein [Mycobacterium sp.]
MSTITRLAGLAIATMGLAHFAKPEAFESITEMAFPDNTRQHIAINGGIETLLGVGLAAPQTRRLAVIGSLGYLAYLSANLIRNNG